MAFSPFVLSVATQSVAKSKDAMSADTTQTFEDDA